MFQSYLGGFPVFLGWTSTKQQIKCLAQGHNTVMPGTVSLTLATFDLQYNAVPTEPLCSATSFIKILHVFLIN